jgi:hypothetical protein
MKKSGPEWSRQTPHAYPHATDDAHHTRQTCIASGRFLASVRQVVGVSPAKLLETAILTL